MKADKKDEVEIVREDKPKTKAKMKIGNKNKKKGKKKKTFANDESEHQVQLNISYMTIYSVNLNQRSYSFWCKKYKYAIGKFKYEKTIINTSRQRIFSLIFRSIARSVSRVARSSFATPVLAPTTCAASTPSLTKPRKESGLARTARSTDPRTRRSTKRMSTWSSAESARKAESCFAATPARALTTWPAASRRSKTCRKERGLVLGARSSHFRARSKRFWPGGGRKTRKRRRRSLRRLNRSPDLPRIPRRRCPPRWRGSSSSSGRTSHTGIAPGSRRFSWTSFIHKLTGSDSLALPLILKL